jgi:hypothetical protein
LLNIWTPEAIQLFILFVVPGFISLKAYELLFPSQQSDSSKQLIDAVSFSSLNFAFLYIPIKLIENQEIKTNCPFFYYISYVFVLFLAPLLWVCIWKKIRLSTWFQSNAPHPTQKPWDFVFAQRKPYYVIVTLKNGTKIGGLYHENSFASSSPAPEQIYLEKSWELNHDARFKKEHNATAGVIILSSEIVTVEFFHLHPIEEVFKNDFKRTRHRQNDKRRYSTRTRGLQANYLGNSK